MHVHAERMAYTMGKECSADARSEDSFFRVPRTRARRFWRLENTQTLEALHQGSVAEKLYSVPVKARF